LPTHSARRSQHRNLAAEDDLKHPRAVDRVREPFQRSAARDQSDANLGVAE
jgi:hypothetical protein